MKTDPQLQTLFNHQIGCCEHTINRHVAFSNIGTIVRKVIDALATEKVSCQKKTGTGELSVASATAAEGITFASRNETGSFDDDNDDRPASYSSISFGRVETVYGKLVC